MLVVDRLSVTDTDFMSTALFDPIKTQSKVTDSVIVAFSGGKESIVTLDLCCRYFKNVKAFFLYICPDLSFKEKTLQWYEKKYQIEIERLPHFDLAQALRYGSFRNVDMSVPIISMNEIYNYVRIKFDTWWIAAGERMDDSLWRRGMIHNSSTIDEKRGRFFPVAMWSKKEILDYIKFHNLYMGVDSRKLGFSFTAPVREELAMVKQYFPDDYEKLIRFYPFAEASLLHYEKYGKKKDKEKDKGEVENGEK